MVRYRLLMPDDELPGSKVHGGDPPTRPALPETDETLLAEPAVETPTIDLETLIGEILRAPDHRLEIEKTVGEGGMAQVEAAVDQGLQRRIARKIISGQLSSRDDAIKLFLREAQISSQLDHPAIVPVHEVGRAEDGRVFFTMKLVDGRPLHELAAELPAGRLDSDDVQRLLEIAIRVCEALEFAHSRGVIHGDVKPSNVMVGEFGAVYLLDWGLARLKNEARAQVHPVLAESRLTGSGGTPAFMAPEQARHDVIDERTDVFLLGGLLFYCLTRSEPYPQGEVAAVMEVAQRGAWNETALGDASPELRRIVRRAMAKAPTDRYQSVAAMRRELRTLLLGGSDLPRRRVAAGEHIIREGEDAQEVYVLEAGRVRVYKTIQGEDLDLREMGEGEVFGEMAILTSSPRTASIVALEDCVLRVITGETLERELGGMKPWLAVLTKALAEKLREREEADAGS